MANELLGVAELTRKLRRLGDGMTVKVLRQATRAGMQPVLERAQETIPQGTVPHRTYQGRLVAPGFAKRSLRIVTKLAKDQKSVSAALGVRREAFYAPFYLELGRSGQPARPWLRPAFKATKSEAQIRLAAKLRQRVLQLTK